MWISCAPSSAPALAALFVATAVLWWTKGTATPFVLVILAEAFIAFRLRHRIDKVTHAAEHAFSDLDLLSSILARIEREKFAQPSLRSLQQMAESGHMSGSKAIARLRKLVDFIMSRDNLIVRLLDVPLMYSVQVLFAVEKWQRRHGPAVRRWLYAVAEL
jgi:hypothetical protein